MITFLQLIIILKKSSTRRLNKASRNKLLLVCFNFFINQKYAIFSQNLESSKIRNYNRNNLNL